MITSLYLGILAILYVRLSAQTIRARRKHKVALGNGPNNEILHLTSAHSNFSSYVSVFTLLLLLMELTGRYPTYMLHSLGIMFVLGRLSHLFAFRTPHTVNKFRTAGMILTLMPIVVTAVSNVLSYFQNGIR